MHQYLFQNVNLIFSLVFFSSNSFNFLVTMGPPAPQVQQQPPPPQPVVVQPVNVQVQPVVVVVEQKPQSENDTSKPKLEEEVKIEENLTSEINELKINNQISEESSLGSRNFANYFNVTD